MAANAETLRFDLSLTLDRYYLTPALRAILHSIVFHRGFALTKPMEVDVEFLEITYVRVDDIEVERLIDERIASFVKTLDFSGGYNKAQSSISISFMERRAKKFWFTKTEEEIAWEQWTVAITVAQSKTERDQIEARKSVEKQLLGCLLAITEKCNEHKDHVPPILNNDTYPFPFQIMGGGLLGTHVRATVNATVYEGLIFAYDPSMGLLVLQSNPSNASPSTATANASASSSSSSSNHTAAAANGPSAKPSAAQTRPDFHVLKTTFISEIVVASTGNALLLANIDEQHFGPTETSAGSGAGAVGGANGDDKGGGGYAALVPVGPVPLDRILAREHAALKAETERVMKIGVGVSREGQSLFNALDKTLPTRWKGDKMIVMDDIVIAPPYTVNDVQSAGDATQVAQVKKVLEAERKRLQSKK